MKDKAFIYEVHYSNFNRYVIPLAEYLVENDIAKEVVLIYDAFTKSEKIQKSANKRIRIEAVKKIYDERKGKDNSNTIFFNYSYRITDLYWTYYFKKIGVHTNQLQHGMYAEFLERSFMGYFSAMNRKMTYLRYLFSFLLKGKVSIFLYLFNKDFTKSFKVNEYIERNKKHKIVPLLSNHVFVWGDYWKDWFMKNHYYTNLGDFTTIGNPDYHTFVKNKEQIKQPEKVCYIAQTFVEDGRMDRSAYKAIIDELSNVVKDRLIIKLHPRSDKEIFETVVRNQGILTYDFPITGYYVGHYSSLLALAINEDSKVYLLEVNEEEIPHYFRNTVDGVFTSMQNLSSAILANNNSDRTSDISYYFKNMEEHPFSLIGKELTDSRN
ncbi:polysialyltransferase family glycosyltransferase [Maribacter sp. 4G9]|uniref:polysialyltransferase family glycosyltransferase n=1 Tax=Maribacter sp. 4G9 TaxID=1889777 RepID=UPI000C15E49B|nr:polysialyltransferase family glycosyltransferase [Maribacter sp. 4G9]PIB23379.1 hypothetical protein BFP75_10250 [Maribacter sp. 4G9]